MSGVGASAGDECEGDDTEDSSSISLDKSSQLDRENTEVPAGYALANFRQQWQRELESSPARRASPQARPHDATDRPESNEELAKELFLRGIESERSGSLEEAVRHYRRALQLAPDIELRLHESTARAPLHEESNVSEKEEIEDTALCDEQEDDEEDDCEGDLLDRLQRIVARNGYICSPRVEPRGGHISRLPPELLLLLLRWVVSAELDVTSLERVGAVCRGLLVASRDAEIWRALCVRTWGLSCGSLKGSSWPSWRQMYTERPRLQYNGCYISRTSYLRHGENSYQDSSYRPWYLIQYYRYLRFFPEGAVLMLTTAEEPAACVALLRQRQARADPAILSGHYRLVGDKVIVALKKQTGERKPAQATNTRFRSRRAAPAEHSHEQTFHLELQLCEHRRRRNVQLAWRGYRVAVRRGDGGDVTTAFDIGGAKFPPLWFSCVRSYHAVAEAPLV